MLVRLQVFLSRNGACSRRAGLKIILDGRVTVDRKVVREPSTPVDSQSRGICLDGNPVGAKQYAYILFNKPAGCITSRCERFARKTVFDLLPSKYRYLVSAGRLDKNTEGLLLLTNDGDAVYKLTHPKFNVDKMYHVKVSGSPGKKEIMRLENGIFLDGKKTSPAKIKNLRSFKDTAEFTITIHEGRKRQIRLMCACIGRKVIFLKRIMQGPLNLGALKTGEWRELTLGEIAALNNLSR